MHRTLLMLALLGFSAGAPAESPQSLLEAYASEAAESQAYAGPSAPAGERLFHRQVKDWSCASCHTADPRREGRHAVTGKAIRPLAPVANPARFSDRARADKWFRRNCNDTLGRECSTAEKADVLAYLISLGNAR